jgi:hypothetical protein
MKHSAKKMADLKELLIRILKSGGNKKLHLHWLSSWMAGMSGVSDLRFRQWLSNSGFGSGSGSGLELEDHLEITQNASVLLKELNFILTTTKKLASHNVGGETPVGGEAPSWSKSLQGGEAPSWGRAPVGDEPLSGRAPVGGESLLGDLSNEVLSIYSNGITAFTTEQMNSFWQFLRHLQTYGEKPGLERIICLRSEYVLLSVAMDYSREQLDLFSDMYQYLVRRFCWKRVQNYKPEWVSKINRILLNGAECYRYYYGLITDPFDFFPWSDEKDLPLVFLKFSDESKIPFYLLDTQCYPMKAEFYNWTSEKEVNNGLVQAETCKTILTTYSQFYGNGGKLYSEEDNDESSDEEVGDDEHVDKKEVAVVRGTQTYAKALLGKKKAVVGRPKLKKSNLGQMVFFGIPVGDEFGIGEEEVLVDEEVVVRKKMENAKKHWNNRKYALPRVDGRKYNHWKGEKISASSV